MLVDMSIPNWTYVGCVCELVYATLWSIPSVVIVADVAMAQRVWLRHHATSTVLTLAEATAELIGFGLTGRTKTGV